MDEENNDENEDKEDRENEDKDIVDIEASQPLDDYRLEEMKFKEP